MKNKVSFGRDSIESKIWIQDIKIDFFTHMIRILIPSKNGGMEWLEMSEHAAREIGFINPEAILKIIK